MILDSAMKNQLRGIFSQLEAHYTFLMTVSPKHESRADLTSLLEEVASCSDKLSCRLVDGDGLKMTLLKEGQDTGISFRAVPGGHEFTSLLLAVLNADGKGKNFPDEYTTKRIKTLRGPINITSYISLTCTNCPDVVQAINLMVLLNPAIRHEAVDGAINEDEAKRMKVQAVPTVYADGELLHVGRGSIGDLIDKLEAKYGSNEAAQAETKEYDVMVLGAGPAGSTAAIYIARKGLKVGLIAERVGGQVNETVGIENITSVPYTTGKQLAADLKKHIGTYSIDLLENRHIEKVEVAEDGKKLLTAKGGETFAAPALIVATGASWRKLNVPGEETYLGRGVAFCPHCDGPFYSGKRVAVVGGGNSGIEAAIDLAGICSEVTVFEFLDTLKADEVLQRKAASLPNVTIITSAQTTQVVGDGQKVTAIRVKDRVTGQERDYELDGIFVQIGLMANSAPFREALEVTRIGEIKIDERCRASLPGVYAAGDVSSVPYKQIIIAMGEGAKAALTAFDDRIRK